MNLIDLLKIKIKNNGPVPFREFMHLSLYHENFGYYRKTFLRTGSKGDFVTSPSASPVFGALISNQIKETWEILKPEKFSLMEIGSGTGYLMKDILDYFFLKDILKNIYNTIIIEPFSVNIEFQKNILKKHINNLSWYENIKSLKNLTGCFICNELIDAFPITLIEKQKDNFFEIYVGIDKEENFIEIPIEINSTELIDYIKHNKLSELPDGYRTEINFNIKKFLKELSGAFNEGIFIFIDYGYSRSEYFHPGRNRGTLLGFKDQKTEDIYKYPGETDITAHVNFSDMVKCAMEYGFNPIGYTTQSAFLASLGLEEVFKDFYSENFTPFSPELAGIKSLFLPQGMGQSHKVLVISKGIKDNIELKGLKLRNSIQRLLNDI